VAAAVESAATDASGGSSPGGELAPAAEAAAGGADKVAWAGIEETSRAATSSSTSKTRMPSTELVLAVSGEAVHPGSAARTALVIIFRITAWRYLVASEVWRIAGETEKRRRQLIDSRRARLDLLLHARVLGPHELGGLDAARSALVAIVARTQAARTAAVGVLIRRVTQVHAQVVQSIGSATELVRRAQHPPLYHALAKRELFHPLYRLTLALVLLPVFADGLVNVELAVPYDGPTDDVLLRQVASSFHVLDRRVVRGKGAHPLASLLELTDSQARSRCA